jgi:hypothetical protein
MHSAVLQVSKDGLAAQAGRCRSLASRLAGNRPALGTGPSVLASAAAVSAAHAVIAAGGVRCASRMQDTATKLEIASACYRDTEAGAAADFRALVRPPVR